MVSEIFAALCANCERRPDACEIRLCHNGATKCTLVKIATLAISLQLLSLFQFKYFTSMKIKKTIYFLRKNTLA